MNNLDFAHSVIEKLAGAGLSEVCLCSGARNAALVEAITSHGGMKIYSFYDERSAAFFAMGRARALGRPVAVCSTSGSAVAELLPAAMEAYYSGAPLVLLTSDRPREYRGSGSPQAVEQLKMFEGHVEHQWDLTIDEVVPEFNVSSLPVHVNVCFDEPILNKPLPKDKPGPDYQASEFASKVTRPLVIVSGLSVLEADRVRVALEKLKLPSVLEATSNLSGDKTLRSLQLLPWAIRAENFLVHFDSVIRVGGVPTLRLFRDLDQKLSRGPVLSFSRLPFSGVARQSNDRVQSLDDFVSFSEANTFAASPALGALAISDSQLSSVFNHSPSSELSCFFNIKQRLPQQCHVFLGNSLPIREWDSVGHFECDAGKVFSAQRGVNGIDGLVSHFLGSVHERLENVLILGDLSFLYDSSGLWALSHLHREASLKIYATNNGGGRTFRRPVEN
ncbi:MAG: 2-succinyl-5-enolpyruvyl-6-hydroxy-3-cyclohexene-1-carboxylic-acid synthase, partial [Bdellovibrionales bacterium]|nr:2-succinyl-5-enolpyruvyl-6-hydroxy-3-cyclohexene-1-carboxylic-acid synthase [Bdellovibrionales bacterium]